MARKIDIKALKSQAVKHIKGAIQVYESARSAKPSWSRSIVPLTAVKLHAIWERFVEDLIIARLNHDSKHFFAMNGIPGKNHLPAKFARYIVRSGRSYFDFRSVDGLKQKASGLLSSNPFKCLDADLTNYIDLLAAVRNHIVHGSDASELTYKRHLKKVYKIKYAPQPDEFLDAVDHRAGSKARNEPRIHGIARAVTEAINST